MMYLQIEREVAIMKRIKAACIIQTLCFSNHDGETTNEDGSIMIEIKKQYNSSPVGEYLNKEGI